jgi:ATP-dependent DNA helicase RecG
MSTGYDPQSLLQRVLVLERQQGFADRAAVGGLATFARAQLARTNGHAGPALLAAVEAVQGYDSRDRRGRESAISEALHALLTGSTARPERAIPQSGPSVENGTGAEGQAYPNAPTREVKKAAAHQTRPRLSIVHRAEELENPITAIKGIRKQAVDALARSGVRTVRELLEYFPRTHYDYTDTRSIRRMRVGVPMTLVGTVRDVRNNRTARGTTITTATISDDSGTVAVRWFNQPYLQSTLPVNARVAITGEPEVRDGSVSFVPRDYELIEAEDLTHAARFVPVYPLTKGLYQRSLRRLVKRVVDEYASAVVDPLPSELQARLKLPDLPEAISLYHFPPDEDAKEWAQQRLAFDELLLVQLGLLMKKRRWQAHFPDVAVPVDDELLERFCGSLPFSLTSAQRRVIASMLEDMSKSVPMSRLLQGDVGSGKTVVAAALLLQVIQAGKQGVLMAPTEILAEQHFRTLSSLLQPFGVRIELLIGSISKTRRRPVYDAAREGTLDLLVGTHALIQQALEFHDLGLAITDEQHRFGVEQRATLRQKGLHPHTLAMTATPIPRSLAMTIYGDLDVSSIDEMPPGRLPVITTWAQSPREAYGVVRDEVRVGHQAFVICPVIEESMESDMRSVVAEHKELQSLVFPDLKVGLLHGRLKPAEKDAVLTAFREGEYDVLVATSVVEVGIDVPNATAMIIRDAHRFGLAQLHQFRGRVGRGGDQAFCILLSTAEGDEARERLEALTATENGFELAEEDLRLRGPGEFWGTRQSGLPALKIATLGDIKTIELSRKAATGIIDADPDLSAAENLALRSAVNRFWADAADLS